MAMVSVIRFLSISINSHRIRLFLVEGIATVIYGVALWFILPDCKRHSQSLIQPLVLKSTANINNQ